MHSDLTYTLIHRVPWFTVRPDLPRTLIYHLPWFTINKKDNVYIIFSYKSSWASFNKVVLFDEVVNIITFMSVHPDLPCTVIYSAPWFTVHPDLLYTLI